MPILRIGPSSQPAIDFEDNTDSNSCTFRLRSVNGSFSIYNTTIGNVPFEVDRNGRPTFRNTATQNAPPNARIDPTTGELVRTAFSPPSLMPYLLNSSSTDADRNNSINAIIQTLIAYGIAQ